MNTGQRAGLLIFLVLLADQALKIYIKTTFLYKEAHTVTDWFILYFIENEGMAFGLTFGGEYGKLILSLFRIVAVGFITWYLVDLVRKKVPPGFIYSIALILAGAFGNIIDSAFYGLMFSESSTSQVATLFPDGGGYAGFLYGRVVDMLYFPLYEDFLPEWIPIWGGDYFIFFQPVFNLADSSITIGVIMIILFQKRYFKTHDKQGNVVEENNNPENAAFGEPGSQEEAPEENTSSKESHLPGEVKPSN